MKVLKSLKIVVFCAIYLTLTACASHSMSIAEDDTSFLNIVRPEPSGRKPELMITPEDKRVHVPPSSAPNTGRPRRENAISTYVDVQEFMEEIAAKHKLDNETLRKTFDNVTFDYSIIDLMNRPAEKRPWSWYYSSMVSAERVEDGVKYMKAHKTALDNASALYKVPQHIITAIIGVETTYGKFVLKRTAVQSLATLAFEYPRRAAYFKSELENLLVLAQKQGLDPLYYRGSYAGAVGIPQFMPSNMTRYASDGDGDGVADIVNNHADAIASVANYLKQHGWKELPHTAALITTAEDIPDDAYVKDICNASNLRTMKQLRALGALIPEKYGDDTKGFLSKLNENEDTGTFQPIVFFENACPVNKYNRSLKYTAAIALLAETIEIQ